MVITHKNLDRYLQQLLKEPEFQIGRHGPADPDAWYRRQCWLEVATGELAKDPLTTLAIVGRANPESASLDGTEGFDAQGLEHKVRIRKELFMALMNMRDLIGLHRGRIVVERDLP
jgi:hypothetical protein